MTGVLSVNIAAMRLPGRVEGDNLIEDLSFTLPRGSFASIIGPSGCGKTTLLRIVGGLERGFDGQVLLDGTPVVRPSRRIQLVFQDSRLLPWKTVAGNLRFAMNDNQSLNEPKIVDEVLSVVRLADRKDAWPRTLSGGEESRVALARALVDPPRVLLLDEPFRNLDFVVKQDIQADLLELLRQQQVTVLQVSHSIEDAVFMSDLVYCVSRGPMKITREVPVALRRPRKRHDQGLKAVCDDILEHMVSVASQKALAVAEGGDGRL